MSTMAIPEPRIPGILHPRDIMEMEFREKGLTKRAAMSLVAGSAPAVETRWRMQALAMRMRMHTRSACKDFKSGRIVTSWMETLPVKHGSFEDLDL
jgi:hypothetical protein